MTDTVRDVAGLSAPRPTAGPRTSIWLMTALALGVLVVTITLGVLLTRGGSSASAQQLTSTQRACQQWTAGYTPSAGSTPTGSWCTAMTDWMREQLHGGHMTGLMMWSDATSMRNTCRSWMATGPAAASAVSPQACDDMMAWMTQHAGSWSTWMMTGRMMGR
jgi:hypothetical protein